MNLGLHQNVAVCRQPGSALAALRVQQDTAAVLVHPRRVFEAESGENGPPALLLRVPTDRGQSQAKLICAEKR